MGQLNSILLEGTIEGKPTGDIPFPGFPGCIGFWLHVKTPDEDVETMEIYCIRDPQKSKMPGRLIEGMLSMPSGSDVRLTGSLFCSTGADIMIQVEHLERKGGMIG